MKVCGIAVVVLGALFGASVYGEAPEVPGVTWAYGPGSGDLDGTAEVSIPEDYVFAGAESTRVLMEAMQNPTSGKELGFLAPTGIEWFVVFEFDEVGYVRDDEKNSLDADAMLESIKKGTEASNKERQRRGWPTMTIVGWAQAPRYSEATHNLEWAITGESGGDTIINYNTRILGRGGVMRVTLVTNPDLLPQTLPKFKDLLAGYAFQKGHRYAEFKKGDKMAKYGLAALVVGGASAVAVQTGLFKWIWKALVLGAVAIGSFFKRFFGGKREGR